MLNKHSTLYPLFPISPECSTMTKKRNKAAKSSAQWGRPQFYFINNTGDPVHQRHRAHVDTLLTARYAISHQPSRPDASWSPWGDCLFRQAGWWRGNVLSCSASFSEHWNGGMHGARLSPDWMSDISCEWEYERDKMAVEPRETY